MFWRSDIGIPKKVRSPLLHEYVCHVGLCVCKYMLGLARQCRSRDNFDELHIGQESHFDRCVGWCLAERVNNPTVISKKFFFYQQQFCRRFGTFEILSVDDNPVNQMVVKNIISSLPGYKVGLCSCLFFVHHQMMIKTMTQTHVRSCFIRLG